MQVVGRSTLVLRSSQWAVAQPPAVIHADMHRMKHCVAVEWLKVKQRIHVCHLDGAGLQLVENFVPFQDRIRQPNKKKIKTSSQFVCCLGGNCGWLIFARFRQASHWRGRCLAKRYAQVSLRNHINFSSLLFSVSFQPPCPKSFYGIAGIVHRSKRKTLKNWQISCKPATRTFGPCSFGNIEAAPKHRAIITVFFPLVSTNHFESHILRIIFCVLTNAEMVFVARKPFSKIEIET